MSDFDRYYRVLGLKPGASLEDVNQAYRQLAFEWHPDRLPKDDQTLQAEAQEKLKALNEARDQLRSRPLRYQTRYSRRAETERRADRYSDRSAAEQERFRSYVYQPPRPTPPQAESSAHADRPRSAQSTSSSRSSVNQSSNANQSSNFASWQQSPPKPPSASNKAKRDLSGTDLQGADLREKDFSGRNLSEANLQNADLSDAFLHRVDLSNANLSSANLFRANLLQADLRNANLQGANLIGADLSGANLSGADLQGAKVGFSDRIMVKLTGAILTGMIMPDGSVHA